MIGEAPRTTNPVHATEPEHVTVVEAEVKRELVPLAPTIPVVNVDLPVPPCGTMNTEANARLGPKRIAPMIMRVFLRRFFILHVDYGKG